MQKYFITTPIFYVNAKPHIGHVYTAVIADVQSRYQKLKNRQVLFTTGTDEHGLKIQQAASKNNMKISDFCAQNSQEFKNTFRNFSVLSDDFGLNGRHHWQLRAAAQRCGAGGCRREAT